MNSREKGARGEREFASYLRENGFTARRGQQHSGSPDSPDVVSDLPVHWEVKRREKLSVYKALDQAVGDAGESTPVVAHRRNQREWVAILRMEDFLDIMRRAPREEGET